MRMTNGSASEQRSRLDGLFELFVFRQPRLSMGRLFICYKFRTMYRGAELFPRSDSLFEKSVNDPRIIRGTKWMRRIGLDELPQLFNVLRGDMHIFGARPIVEAELTKLSPKQQRLRQQRKAGCFGPYAMLRTGRNDMNLSQANQAFLILFDRKRRQGRTSLIFFQSWVIWRTFVAVLEGKVK